MIFHTTASRLASAGCKEGDAINKPFIGAGEMSTDASIRALEEGGPLSLNNYIGSNGDSHEGRESQCDSHITCSREAASRISKMAVVGVAVACCPHMIPTVGSLVDMRTEACDIPGVNGITFMVNWMHGASHNIKCQLNNLGRYIDGAGHRDGENVEEFSG